MIQMTHKDTLEQKTEEDKKNEDTKNRSDQRWEDRAHRKQRNWCDKESLKHKGVINIINIQLFYIKLHINNYIITV